ncbi:hypothetical protein EZJ19_13115 [Parasulfuritortus cantonensis]|uniref:Periplasmic heavy metal sensor n=1 Tax=Parasulfuritortus cantonensis TaxID=2528202 RepID=A0A4R1B2I2_9PROT|nr:hypothetical protein [Parasulfuritortus cantonensis]TCJ12272.1 hypothetical protein EZJ19_13115 [Parasulfuritortus cantonensis]
MNASRKRKTIALLGLTSLSVLAGSAQADNGYYGNGYQPGNPWLANQAQPRYYNNMRDNVADLDKRMDNQMQRILTGMEKGDLTMREAVSLLREHLAISTQERQYLADGRLGQNELRDLDRRLNEASQHIRFERHDREETGGARPYNYDRR